MDTLDLRAAELMGEQRNALSRMHDEVILGMTEDTDNTYRIRTQEEGICGGSFGINYTGDDGSTVEAIDTSENSFQVIPVDFVAKGTRTVAGMISTRLPNLSAVTRSSTPGAPERGTTLWWLFPPSSTWIWCSWNNTKQELRLFLPD